MFEKIIDKVAKLIDLKSIMTLSLTVLFIILALKQVIDGNAVMTVYTTVIAFYFGTQFSKDKKESEIKKEK